MLNLTPHEIVVYGDDGTPHVFTPSRHVARVEFEEFDLGRCPTTGVRVIARRTGPVSGMPTDGTPCLVSALVLEALPSGFENVYVPDSGPTAIRDGLGRIVGVRRLVTRTDLQMRAVRLSTGGEP